MTRKNRIAADVPAQWRRGPSIERWQRGLSSLTGCSRREITERLDVLLQFCVRQGISPEDMIGQCRRGIDPMARRKHYLDAARQIEANLVIQSFLVHNGVNIFGELVCMPATAEAVIEEQGPQWSRPER